MGLKCCSFYHRFSLRAMRKMKEPAASFPLIGVTWESVNAECILSCVVGSGWPCGHSGPYAAIFLFCNY